MNAVDYILEGLEAELALERELGVRMVECDRALLAPLPVAEAPSVLRSPVAPLEESRPKAERAAMAQTGQGKAFDFVFLHDRPLAEAEREMMAKIAIALGKSPEEAPVLHEEPLPKAKAYIVLGRLALDKWFPSVSGAPGDWVATPVSPNVLITYSPGYILRFSTVTDAVKKIKRDMWTSIKSVLNRVRMS